MRPTGYYFVEYNGRNEIMRWAKVIDTFNDYKEYWVFEWNGTQFEESELDYISPTPITPEKMAAIDEIVSYLNQPQPPMDLSGAIILVKINDILIKHKLI